MTEQTNHIIEFGKHFSKYAKKRQYVMFPKKLKLNISDEPLVLPEKLMSPMNFENELVVKNALFLKQINALNGSDIVDKLKKESISFNTDIFVLLSQIVPIVFSEDMDFKIDLQTVDLSRHIHDKIEEKLNVIKQKILEFDLHQYILDELKNDIFYGRGRNYPISQTKDYYDNFIIKPFESIVTGFRKNFEIFSHLIDKNLKEKINNWIDSYFDKKNDIENYSVVSELSYFFNTLNQYYKLSDRKSIKKYSLFKFLNHYDKLIVIELSEKYSHHKKINSHFSYSIQFYNECIKPLIKKLE